ncbi:MAG TPA: mannonate dehydratase [Armatimonadota bacterium]|nr:mannonate dehydratase [Armatimonadota bacterium]
MIDLNELPMRIAIGQFNELNDEQLAFARQCGADDISLNTPKLPGDERWEYEDLLAWRRRAEDHGLRLMALENVPRTFYDKIMLGQAGRDRQLENMIATVRSMGRAGIPILGYHWMPNGVWRTRRDDRIRGGAISNSFDYEIARKSPLTHDRVYTEDEMWANYDWYLERLLPVCEEAEVRLAIHPDDPPLPELGGIGRLFCGFEGFRRAMEKHPSPMHGLNYCHGCWSEMRGGAGVMESIEWFGTRGRLIYGHFRDVRGSAEKFTEQFVNDGNNDMFMVMKKFKESGFRGFLIDDHVPRMVNDSPWCHRGRAFATGYMAAMIQAVNSSVS